MISEETKIQKQRISGDRSILKRIGSKALQNVFVPDKESLQEALDIFDIGVKLEFLHIELTSQILHGSLFEIVLFIVGLCIFVKRPSHMGLLWCFLPHVLRGVIGLFVLWGIPLTHDIIKAANFPDQERIDLVQVIRYLNDAVIQALDHWTNLTKQRLMAYVGITMFCGWLDLVLLFVTLVRFSKGKDPYSDIPLLIISAGMLCGNGMYASWLLSVYQRVPDRLGDSLTMAMGGQFDTLITQATQYQADYEQERAQRVKKATMSRPDDSVNVGVVQREAQMVQIEA